MATEPTSQAGGGVQAGYAGRPFGRFKKALPMVCFTASLFFLNYIDRSLIGPLLSFLEVEFSMDHAQAAGLMLYLSVGYSVSILVSTYTAPLVKPRHMIVLSITGCGLAMLGMTLVHSGMTFGFMLAVLGFMAGQYFASGMATLKSLVAPQDWTRAVSIHELGPNLSFVLAPVIAMWGASRFGWRMVPLGAGVVSLLMALAYLLFGKGGNEKPALVPLNGVAGYFASPKLWLVILFFSAAVAGQFAPYTVLTLHMVDDRLFSPEFAASLLSLSRLPCPLAVLLGGWLVNRLGIRNSMYLFFSLFALGTFLLAVPWNGLMYVGLFLQPLSSALVIPPIFALLMELYAEKELALLISISLPPACLVGLGFFPSFLGLMGKYVSFPAGFVCMGVFVALVPVILHFSRNMTKHRPIA